MRLIWTGFVLASAAVTGWLVAMQRRHGAGALAWRWLSGHSLDGEHRTNATWLRPASEVLHESGRAVRWHHLPRLARAGIRAGASAATVAILRGLAAAPRATVTGLAVTAALVVLLTCAFVIRWARRLRHRWVWLAPLHRSIAPLAGVALTARPESWITVARDRSQAVLALPSGFRGEPGERERIASITAARLGIESPEAAWHIAGPRPTLTLAASKPPPTRVALADVLGAVERAAPDELVWGLGKHGQVVTTSLSLDSPHIGLSMGSGGGKSATARALLAQRLHRGDIGLILDPKMISHQWAAGLPNCVIVRRPAEIHRALVWLGAELDRRNEVALTASDLDGNVHATVGPRLVIVFEEMNAAVKALRRYWADIRDREDPVRSPALDALDTVSFMGRQVRVNVMYVGQRLSVRAAGGDGDARENIGVVGFARYSPSNWRMLAADHPMPPKSLHPGRLQVVSDRVRETQGVWMTGAEARELALSGVVSPLPAGMPGAPRVTGVTDQIESGHEPPDVGFVTVTGPAGPDGVTLAEAVGAGVVPLTLAALRQRRHRDPGFPRPVGHRGLAQVFDPVALAAYARGADDASA